MSISSHADEKAPKNDGLNLRNCGYALLLIVSYIMLALVIGSVVSK